jgi:hypothetical protein
MAKEVASRATCDEAFRERRERAAARFSSIHERWPATAETPALNAASPEPPASGVAVGQHAPGPPVAEGGVGVAPILGIATDDEEARPRFKTLMGVPRTDPDVDESAGLDVAAPHTAKDLASARSDTARLQRPTPPPLPMRFHSLPEAARPPSAGGALQAAASLRAPGTLPPRATRTAPPRGSAGLSSNGPSSSGLSGRESLSLSQSSADVPLARAARRRSQRRRGWLVGIASFTATLAGFALAAPGERELAVRWLSDEYQSWIQPSMDTVANTARALRPGRVVEPADRGLAPTSSSGVAMRGTVAEPQRIEERAPPAGFARPAATGSAATAIAAPATEVASEPRSETASGSVSSTSLLTPARADEAPKPRPSEVSPRAGAGSTSPSTPHRAAGDENAPSSPSKLQLAAPRKRSTRSTVATAPAARPTKERATRQNTSRRDVNGGIIRETPF